MKVRAQNLKEDQTFMEELRIPDYVELKEKYKCEECLCYDCNGKPCKRTQCKKRCWIFSTLFSLLTGCVIAIVLFVTFSYVQDLLLSLSCTIIFAVGMDIICCFIEYAVDKIFESIEKSRRKRYDKKLANIEAINRAKKQEFERKKEKEEAAYKDINEAKSLFLSLSGEYLDKLSQVSDNSKKFPKLKKELFNSYKELLKTMGSLLEHITLENFNFSEIKGLFKVYLPKLREYLTLYMESVENKKETDLQIKELTKLLESFNTHIIRIQENLNNSDSESIIYKMQALREVISHTYNEEEQE